MRLLSLNWKMAAGFTALTCMLIALYTWIAKGSFEDDKIAYMAESQRVQTLGLAAKVDGQIRRVVQDAVAIANGDYDLFRDHPEIVALQVQAEDGRTLARPLEKDQGALALAAYLQPLPGKPEWKTQNGERIALAFIDDEKRTVRITFRWPQGLGEVSRGHAAALAASGNILIRNAADPELDPALESAAAKFARGDGAPARFEKIDGRSYLIRAAKIGFGDLQIVSLLPEQEALRAPVALFRRSIIYLMLCFGLIALGTLYISDRWSKVILVPAQPTPEPEVQRRVLESTERALFNLKRENAAIVRANLMPETSNYRNGRIALSGTHFAAADAGGDWWYYVQRESELFLMIADTTASGVSAALMTAAARAAFTNINDGDQDLKIFARALERAVYDCSNGETAMSALLLKINVELGEGRFINAGHEPAILIRNDGATEMVSGLDNPKFGKGNEAWAESLIELNPGEKLYLWTDGMLGAFGSFAKADQLLNMRNYLREISRGDRRPDLLNNQIAEHYNTKSDDDWRDDATFAILEYR